MRKVIIRKRNESFLRNRGYKKYKFFNGMITGYGSKISQTPVDILPPVMFKKWYKKYI